MTECKKSDNLSLTKSSEHLNKQILEYYYKFGQNRDLEKYLRLNRKTNKSSSEGSLSGISVKYSDHIYTKKPSLNRQTKSLDCFDHTTSSECILEETECNSNKNLYTGNNCFELYEDSKQFQQITRQNATDVRCDIPEFADEDELQAISTSLFPNPSLSEMFDAKFEIPLQTNDVFKPNDSNNPIDIKSEQIQIEQKDIKIQETPERHKKNAKILEWDSLGDVGYNRSTENSNLNRSMSTIERSVLRGFFADRGIEISFPANKVQNKKEKSTENWRVTLENIKKKYSSSPNLLKRNTIENSKQQSKLISPQNGTSSTFLCNLSKNFHFQNKNSNSQSTPKLEIQDKSFTQTSKKEQYCQTSIIGMEDQLVQCNFSATSNSVTGNSIAGSQSSFIYLANEYESTENGSNGTTSSKELNTVKTSIERNSELHESFSKLIEMRNDKHLKAKFKEIDIGISFLCSLIGSKKLNDYQKKKLAQKIVSKITKHHTKHISTNESKSSIHSCISEIESLTISSSSSNKITSRKFTKSTKDVGTQLDDNRDLKKDDPKIPGGYESLNKRISEDKILNTAEKIKPSYNAKEEPTDVMSINQSIDIKNSKFYKKKYDPQLFETMKEWLEPLTNSELEYNKKINKASKEQINSDKSKPSYVSIETKVKKTNDTKDVHKRIHLNWIENEIRRLENLKNLLITENEHTNTIKNIKTTAAIQLGSNVEREYGNVVESVQLAHKANSIDVENHVYDGTHSGANHIESDLKPTSEIDQNYVSESQMRRSKLKTPKENQDHDSSDSIRTFVKNKKREFIENYKIAHSSRRSYDHPMISDHYSEPGYKNIPIANKDFIFTSKYRNITPSTSNDFISSETISLPANSGNSSTSTTHQYDTTTINGIGVQTSDSIFQTSPFFGVSSNDKYDKIHTNNVRKTTRFYGPSGKNQQIQVKPQTIFYTIKVDNKNTEIRNNENLSLQEHLQKQCPQFYLRASKRQRILNEMQRLRKEREEQIRNIVENTSMNSINRKLSQVPPPATKCIRVFSTKEMKALTKKKQRCLSEVVDKVEKQKKQKQRRGTKILTDVFNKRLQKQVHKGKLSLEHSITVI